MVIAECKSEKLWKYLDGPAINPGPDPRGLPSSITIVKEGRASPTVDTAMVEAWLDKKEAVEVGFEQAKNKCFMSVNKFHLAKILEPPTVKEMFARQEIFRHQRCLSTSTSSRL